MSSPRSLTCWPDSFSLARHMEILFDIGDGESRTSSSSGTMLKCDRLIKKLKLSVRSHCYFLSYLQPNPCNVSQVCICLWRCLVLVAFSTPVSALGPLILGHFPFRWSLVSFIDKFNHLFYAFINYFCFPPVLLIDFAFLEMIFFVDDLLLLILLVL